VCILVLIVMEKGTWEHLNGERVLRKIRTRALVAHIFLVLMVQHAPPQQQLKAMGATGRLAPRYRGSMVR
jgi:hypothetical protein